MRIQDIFVAASMVLALVPTHAAASDADDVKATVSKWVGEFNSGDKKAFAAGCAARAAIVDSFSPYMWETCTAWMASSAAASKAGQLSDLRLSVGKPISANVDAQNAYMAYLATFTAKEKGKPISYNGTWTLALHKEQRGWTVTGSTLTLGGNYSVHNSP